ncbi:MAG: branched-chain amino acid ABC transporter permease [Candidatus Rokubacteria bacterium]|nr:branched-chain amino acid ABC transporter permease [Candidatus Rokubacteria bacterium]
MSDYFVSLLIRIGIEAFVALSAYLLLLMGRMSFGQQGFFVIGAYAAGLATALYGMPLLPGVALGALVAALGGALFAGPMAAPRGLAFAAGSLAFGELVRVALLDLYFQGQVGPDLIGPAGPDGFRGIRALFTSGVSVTTYAVGIWLALGVTLLATAFFLRSRWGEALRMIGEDEEAAATVGLPVRRVKVSALAGAGGLAGLGGGLFAHYATYVEPGHADVMLGVHSLAYAFIGGLGTPLGPIIGVALDIGFLESFRFLAGYRMIIFGGLVMGLLIVRPRGLLDEVAVHRLSRFLMRGRR